MADKVALNKFEYEIGSNVVVVNGEKKYLNKIVWTEVTYADVKENVVG